MAERKAFLLRIDPALWADLEAWAQDEFRSVNGQVEYLLKQAVAKRRGSPAAETESLPAEPATRGRAPIPPPPAPQAVSPFSDTWID